MEISCSSHKQTQSLLFLSHLIYDVAERFLRERKHTHTFLATIVIYSINFFMRKKSFH